MIRKATKIGDPVMDMHGRGRIANGALMQVYQVRNAIEFPLSDCDKLRHDEGHTLSQARSLEAWLDTLSRDAGRGPYCNKMLIVVAESSEDGWMRVAYMYDSRRFGIAEIKQHGERLHDALIHGR